jgi:hypothetical protein
MSRRLLPHGRLKVTGDFARTRSVGAQVVTFTLNGYTVGNGTNLTLGWTDFSGASPVSKGGTGLTSGTSGGIPYYSSSTTIASSAALTANRLVKGGGAGAAPADSTITDSGTGTITTGTGISTGDAGLELGGGRSGSGHAYIDLHTTSGSDYEARFLRIAGANGAAQFVNTGTGAFTFDNPAGVAVAGTNTNDNAASTYIGEYVSSATSASQTTATVSNLTTISLTAGDWDVYGAISYTGSGQVLFDAYACISTTTQDTSQSNMGTAPWSRHQGTAIFNALTAAPSPLRVSISGTTTVYLVAFCQFGSGTVTAYGNLRARRVR